MVTNKCPIYQFSVCTFESESSSQALAPILQLFTGNQATAECEPNIFDEPNSFLELKCIIYLSKTRLRAQQLRTSAMEKINGFIATVDLISDEKKSQSDSLLDHVIISFQMAENRDVAENSPIICILIKLSLMLHIYRNIQSLKKRDGMRM